MTTQCAWCRKIKISGDWVVSTPMGIVTHGICPACKVEVRGEFQNHLRRARNALSAGVAINF
jgi:hypothetical protein